MEERKSKVRAKHLERKYERRKEKMKFKSEKHALKLESLWKKKKTEINGKKCK